MANNAFRGFQEGANRFTAKERSEISKSFRKDLQDYKIGGAIMKVVTTSSEKVPVYVNVLCQQCRKKSFAAEFEAECSKLRKLYIRDHMAVAEKIRQLHEAVMESLP